MTDADYDDDMEPDEPDATTTLRTLVRRAFAQGLFVDVPPDQPFGEDEEQLEFESLIPGQGRLTLDVWSEGRISWRAAATWHPWDELVGRRQGLWMRAGGDTLWAVREEAVVEALYAIAPATGMTPVDLVRLREPSLRELEATARTLQLCSGGQLSLYLARRLAAMRYGWLDWDDMLDEKRRRPRWAV